MRLFPILYAAYLLSVVNVVVLRKVARENTSLELARARRDFREVSTLRKGVEGAINSSLKYP